MTPPATNAYARIDVVSTEDGSVRVSHVYANHARAQHEYDELVRALREFHGLHVRLTVGAETRS